MCMIDISRGVDQANRTAYNHLRRFDKKPWLEASWDEQARHEHMLHMHICNILLRWSFALIYNIYHRDLVSRFDERSSLAHHAIIRVSCIRDMHAHFKRSLCRVSSFCCQSCVVWQCFHKITPHKMTSGPYSCTLLRHVRKCSAKTGRCSVLLVMWLPGMIWMSTSLSSINLRHPFLRKGSSSVQKNVILPG